MTTGAAVIAIVASLMAGYYFAQWRRSEGSLRSAKTLVQGAGKGAWKARRNLLLTRPFIRLPGRGTALSAAAPGDQATE